MTIYGTQLPAHLLVQRRNMKPVRTLSPLIMVDDNDDDAVIFTRRLKDAGVRNPLVHFRQGGDAFMFLKQFCTGSKAADQLPSVMFLDVNMPNLSGFDLLVWARQQPALQGMKIIMLSGATEPWDAQIAAKLGADNYLMKFPEAQQLSKLLSTLVESTSAV